MENPDNILDEQTLYDGAESGIESQIDLSDPQTFLFARESEEQKAQRVVAEKSKSEASELDLYIKKYSEMTDRNAAHSKVDNIKRLVEDFKANKLGEGFDNYSDVLNTIKTLEDRLDPQQSLMSSFFEATIDVPVQLVGALRDTLQSVNDLVNVALGVDLNLPDVKESKFLPNQMLRALVPWLSVYSGATKALNAAGFVAKTVPQAIATSATVGAGTDLFLTKKGDSNLTGIIKDLGLKVPFIDYLATTGNDTLLQRKLKVAIEGAGLGIVGDVLFNVAKVTKQHFAIQRAKEKDTAARTLDIVESLKEGKILLEDLSLADVIEDLTKNPNVKDAFIKAKKLQKEFGHDPVTKRLVSREKKTLKRVFEGLLGEATPTTKAEAKKAQKLAAKLNKNFTRINLTPRTLESIWNVGNQSSETVEKVLTGRTRRKAFRGKATVPDAIRTTQVQEAYNDKLKTRIPSYIDRVFVQNDTTALDDYMQEIMLQVALDSNAKDVHRIISNTDAFTLRGKLESVRVANLFQEILSKSSIRSKQDLAKLHMGLVYFGDDPKNLNRLTRMYYRAGEKGFTDFVKNTYVNFIVSSELTALRSLLDSTLNGLVIKPFETAIASGIGYLREELTDIGKNSWRVATHLKTKDKNAVQKAVNLSMEQFFNTQGYLGRHRFDEVMLDYRSASESIWSGLEYISEMIARESKYNTRSLSGLVNSARDGFKEVYDAGVQYRFDKGTTHEIEEASGKKRVFTNYINGEKRELTPDFFAQSEGSGIFSEMSDMISKLVYPLVMGDNFISGMLFDASVKKQVLRLHANNPSLFKNQDEIDGFIAKLLKRNPDEGVRADRVIRDIQNTGVEDARIATYQNDVGEFGEVIYKLRNNIDDMFKIIPAGTMLLPLIKTATNMIDYTLGQRTPLALLTNRFYNDIKAGGGTLDMALAKMASGTFMLGTGLFLSFQGYITGAGSNKVAEQQSLNQLGYLPYAARIGDTYVDLAPLGAISILLSIPSVVHDIVEYSDDDLTDYDRTEVYSALTLGALGLSTVLTDKLPTQGLIDLITKIKKQDHDGLEKFINNLVASGVFPNAVSSLAQRFNDHIYEAHNLTDAIKRKIGIGRLPYRDIFGRPLEKTKKSYYMNLLPLSYSEHRDDPVFTSLLANGINITKPKRSIEGVDLSPEEYDTMMSYIQEMGAYDEIKRLVLSDEFKNITGEETEDENNSVGLVQKIKGDLVKRFYTSFVDVAKNRLLSENKFLAFKVDLSRERKISDPRSSKIARDFLKNHSNN